MFHLSFAPKTFGLEHLTIWWWWWVLTWPPMVWSVVTGGSMNVHGETLPSFSFQRYSKRSGRQEFVFSSFLETPRANTWCFDGDFWVFLWRGDAFGNLWDGVCTGWLFHPCALHPTSAHLVRASQPFAGDLSNSFQPRPVHPRCWCMSADLLLVMSCLGGDSLLHAPSQTWRDQRRKGPHHTRKP